MGFYHIVIRLIKSQAIPIAKSILKAYKHSTQQANSTGSAHSSSGNNKIIKVKDILLMISLKACYKKQTYHLRPSIKWQPCKF